MKRKWWTEKGKVDKEGNQVWMSTCKRDSSRRIAYSESYPTPTCGHPECRPSSDEPRIYK